MPLEAFKAKLAAEHLTIAQLSEQLGKKPRTLQDWRTRSYGPRWWKNGSQVLYSIESVNAWIEAQQSQTA